MTSQNSSKLTPENHLPNQSIVGDIQTDQGKKPSKRPINRWWWLLILPLWVFGAFWAAQLVVILVVGLLGWLGVGLGAINPVLLTMIASVVIYSLALAIVIVVPLKIWKRRTTLGEMGVTDWPSWMDLLLTPLAMIVYMFTSGIVILIVTKIATGIDVNQPQELPFSQSMLGTQAQYLMAFLTLVVLAPLAEELLFRGYLYGKLRKSAPIWLAVLVTSITFGLAHLWAGPGSALQWTVAIDTLVLSVYMCLMREYTGAIWVGLLMHMIKNGLAFYLLFINPNIVNQLEAAILPFI